MRERERESKRERERKREGAGNAWAQGPQVSMLEVVAFTLLPE